MFGVQLADILTIDALRTKVKQGVKMMAIYRHDSRACVRMWSSAEVTWPALAQLVLTPLPSCYTVTT